MKRLWISIAALWLASVAPALAASSTVAAMPAASAFTGTELLYMVQSSADTKATPAQMATYIEGLISGDCTIASNVITCTKTSGTAFGPYATAARGSLVGSNSNTAASAGNVGEVVEASAAVGAVSLTAGSGQTITSVSLTAGDWDVSSVTVLSGTATSISLMQSSTSTTTNTADATVGNYAELSSPAAFGSNVTTLTTQPKQYLLSATTTVFLVTQCNFSGGTCSAGGKIHARRMH